MSAVTFIGSVTAKAGSEGELATMIKEFVETVRAGDPGTLSFGFYETEVPGRYIAVEVYKDSDAVAGHLDNVQHLFGRLGDLLDPDAHETPHVYGDPSPAVRERYAPFAPEYHPIAGAL